MSPKLSPKTDFLPRRDLVQATERSAEESTEEEEVVLEAVTVAPAAGERHSDRDAEDDMPTEEAITFNFDRSRDVLNTEEQGSVNQHCICHKHSFESSRCPMTCTCALVQPDIDDVEVRGTSPTFATCFFFRRNGDGRRHGTLGGDGEKHPEPERRGQPRT